MEIAGFFFHGKRCVISEGANIIVPSEASLLFGDESFIGRYVELGPLSCIKIGNKTSLQDRCIVVGDVNIGQNCLLSLNVLITSGTHYYSLFPSWLIKDQDRYVQKMPNLRRSHSRPVVIEDDCWLGVNSVVMPGVTIGKGAIVGANSVVTHDVRPYTVVAGAPAILIKKRLNFLPPVSLDYKCENNWPYFYSGFDYSTESTGNSIGIQINQKEFVLAMCCKMKDKIIMTVVKKGNSICLLSHQYQSIELMDGVNKIEFIIEKISNYKIIFEIKKNNNQDEILLIDANIIDHQNKSENF
jgi:acetyltransferase-like isoleucine patch superfamily enzyme